MNITNSKVVLKEQPIYMGNPEIYTREELIARVKYGATIPRTDIWHKKWLKDVHVQHSAMYAAMEISYHGTLTYMYANSL